MLRNAVHTALALVVSLAVASPLYAQNPNAQKPKKNANQVPETGPNDPDAAPDTRFDRAVENLTFTTLSDGTVMAELDESFMEATTVSIGADGNLKFEHFTGVAKAEQAVRRTVNGVRPADGLLRSHALPLLYPIYEDKE